MPYIILCSTLIPVALALLCFVIKQDLIRNWIMRLGAVGVMGMSILTAYGYFSGKFTKTLDTIGGKDIFEVINTSMLVIEILIFLLILYLSIKYKKIIAPVFGALQLGLMSWFEHTHKFEVIEYIVLDHLAVIMLLIVGVVGGLIALYTVGYMKWYHKVHSEVKERTGFFFAVVLMFLGAMTGLVLFNNLIWLYFCWEVTSLSSFLLIGYTKSNEATNNAYRALNINLGGGLALALGIIYCGIKLESIELTDLIYSAPTTTALIPAMLLSFAALTKSAQFPFQSWLLGAMVAPTPSSALLHSATMVKAGVYLLLRLSPLLGTTSVGRTVTFIGGITFLAASLLAITVSDAKRILAYSTIANLGLIITCTGIATAEALWAAIFLVIFHAVSKSLLFLCVGEIEHQLHTRKVDKMSDLFRISRSLAVFLLIGIAGMFLAPFGMLISKWAAMKAFIDSNNLHILMILCFGSAATLFYWAKWMGKIVSLSATNMPKQKFPLDERISLIVHSILTLSACFLFPFVSNKVVLPYLRNMFADSYMPIAQGDVWLMIAMFSMLIILPLSFIPISKKQKGRKVLTYMAGENIGDDHSFHGALGVDLEAKSSNWYMRGLFKDVPYYGNFICTAAMIVAVVMLAWEVLK
ncbi:MAG: NADH-quinone oxidoreductase subunit L [Oscillospiraceae bacterium]|jgi:ech hydrogenase subunit A|nr:NADH-quinone oxidoreductase subunit L [Oscillospiraceae bacterium]